MTVSSTTSRNDYVAAGGQTVYPYTYIIYATTDLLAYRNGTLLAYGADYTIDVVGVSTGGNVTLTTASTAGDTVALVRSVPAIQSTSYPYNGPFPEKSHETALDRLTVIAQQIIASLTRTLALKTASLFSAITVCDPVVGQYLYWKDTSTVSSGAIAISGTLPDPVTAAHGGTGGTNAQTGRAGLRVDGQVVGSLINNTVSTQVAGDVVTPDPTVAGKVKAVDTQGAILPYFVALDTPIAGAAGDYVYSGRCTAKAQGAITAGHYVRKSATSLAVEDTTVAAAAATSAPSGAIGVALGAAAGGFVDMDLFPSAAGSTPAVVGMYRVHGLIGVFNAATPNDKFDWAADQIQVRNPSDGSIKVSSTVATVTNDKTSALALNGRDQAGAFNVSSWVHHYYITKADGTVGGTLSSATAPTTGPTLIATYTHWAYLGAIYNDSAGHYVPATYRGCKSYNKARQLALNAGGATSETAISLAAFVPANALEVDLHHRTGNSAQMITFRWTTGSDFYVSEQVTYTSPSANKWVRPVPPMPVVGQQVLYLVDAGVTDVWVSAFKIANGDS